MSSPPAGRASGLVPRFEDQGYTAESVAARRAWVEERTGTRLAHVGSSSLAAEDMRGNIENPIGAVQVPLGVVGPLLVQGEHAQGEFFIPFATTEGALVRSYERGMVVLSRAGGVTTRLVRDENRVSPAFHFDSVASAVTFVRELPGHFEGLRAAAEATTRHGRLLSVEPLLVGREVILHFNYFTADAHGMNMIVRATDAACRWLAERVASEGYLIFSGAESEKRGSGSLLAGGKGKTVTAGARVPARFVSLYLGTTPSVLVELWRRTAIGHFAAGTLGYNGHFANGLTAMAIACGQDVANVVNSAVGVSSFELTAEGDLYISLTLPALTIGTVGGGTGLGTAAECLAMMGCTGAGSAPKLAEIMAGALLAGELSFGAAVATGDMVAGHERYGRNRPAKDQASKSS